MTVQTDRQIFLNIQLLFDWALLRQLATWVTCWFVNQLTGLKIVLKHRHAICQTCLFAKQKNVGWWPPYQLTSPFKQWAINPSRSIVIHRISPTTEGSDVEERRWAAKEFNYVRFDGRPRRMTVRDLMKAAVEDPDLEVRVKIGLLAQK